MLRHFSALSSYADIAAACEMPVGTVRSRLRSPRPDGRGSAVDRRPGSRRRSCTDPGQPGMKSSRRWTHPGLACLCRGTSPNCGRRTSR
ncbi:hypothetical protein [Streptomyces chiangmaiensis]|uniref:hypothetical protein n=1 Tax=Streptomyces chiangmaiensis TaxID=766497 RepID=UPI00364234DB